MRKEYGKALREIFATKMQTDLPNWRPVRLPKAHYWGGERAYMLDIPSAAWLVIILEPNVKDHDAFDIEVGWSLHRRVPELGMRPCVEDPNSAEAVARDEYLCRLSDLVGDQDYQNGWVIDRRTFSSDPDETLAALIDRQTRISAEEARSAVFPFVEDALLVLARHGVPYLEARLPLLAARSSRASFDSGALDPPGT